MKQFFFFGDSITLGVNDPRDGGWVGRFVSSILDTHALPVPPTTFYNLGVRKNASRAILDRWQAEYTLRKFPGAQHYFIFCFGTVDTVLVNGAPNVGLDESAANAQAILSSAKNEGKVLFMTAPPVTDAGHSQRIADLMGRYASVCEQLDVPFLDTFSKLAAATDYMASLSDGIHPGPDGNQIVAKLLLQAPTVQSWMQEK